jgi:alpha-galactosidase
MIDIDEPLAPWAGPGFWNDNDMLEVGNGMSETEDRSHFALWCILASPLIAGNDLRSMTEITRSILTNPGVIAVNQDPLGAQAIVCASGNNTQVWAKPMADGSTVVLLLNRDDKTAMDIAAPLRGCIQHGATESAIATDVWTGSSLGSVTESFVAKGVAPHASVFVKLMPSATVGAGEC